MPEPNVSEILDFAIALSLEAGRFIMPLWKNVAVDHKADGSEVTAADRGAEQLLRKRIAERYPDHAILGEEFGGSKSAMPSTCGCSIPSMARHRLLWACLSLGHSSDISEVVRPVWV